jgi:hypothetical protein
MLALAAPASATPTTKQWQWEYRKWMPPVWQRLARCESGSNPPNWQHNSGTYQGAFGFYHGSWDDYRYPGYPTDAHRATPWQQYRVALRIHARYGFTGWGCYRHAWVRG